VMLNFAVSRTMKNNYLLFKNPGYGVFVMVIWEDKNNIKHVQMADI
jgi:hypothetical protein